MFFRGLAWASKRKKRFSFLTKFLQDPVNSYDFVTLQEVWFRSDYNRLQRDLISLYPHSVYFPSGVIGSGLAIFSRHPILQSFFKRFSLCGAPDRFWHGDFYSGKGIGAIRILWNGLVLNVYTTHMHAEYKRRGFLYEAHRLTQLEEIVQFVEQTSRPAHLAIVTGDLNTQPNEFIYRMMIEEGCSNRFDQPLIDAWRVVRGEYTINRDSIDLSSQPGKVNEEVQGGFTCNVPTNTFTRRGHIPQRIDYIMFAPRPGFKCINMSVITEDAPYDSKISFSDHNPIHATFIVDPSALHALDKMDFGGVQMTPHQLACRKELVDKAIQILIKDRDRVKMWQRIYQALAVIFLLIFLGITIATAITIPNGQLTPILTLALFGIQPAVLVSLFSGIIMARLFLQEERNALAHFINDWKLWLLQYEQSTEDVLSDVE